MPRKPSIVSGHIPSRLATDLLPLLDDSDRFGRVNWLVKTEADIALVLVDMLLEERREQDEDLGVRAEQAWWRVWCKLKGEVVGSQYAIPEFPLNLFQHLQVIETLELSFAIERALGTNKGKRLAELYKDEKRVTYAA